MKVDYFSSKYKVYCNTCSIMIMSYNDEHYAKQALHNAKYAGSKNANRHRGHDVIIRV